MKTENFNFRAQYQAPGVKMVMLTSKRSLMVVSNEYLRYGNDPGTIVGGEDEQDYGDM